MKTITGLFDTYAEAENAVLALKASGIAEDDISLISRDPDRIGDKTDGGASEGMGVGSGLGLVAGGAGGLLAGLGMLAIPGIGPVVAAGWLASTLAGAAAGAVVGGATGGVIGALTSSDVTEEDAHVYAEGVRRGGTLVTAHVHDDRIIEAQGILDRAGRINIGERRRTYTEAGWDKFDPDLTAHDSGPAEARDEFEGRQRRRLGGF
jgi:hypothetical protein